MDAIKRREFALRYLKVLREAFWAYKWEFKVDVPQPPTRYFHVVLGKLAAQAAKEKPLSSRINTGDSEPEEFLLDDESKLRYRINRV